MKISYNWIRDYLKIEIDPHKLSDILTAIGLEVEGVEDWQSIKGGLKGIVIGEVLTCRKHPDADKLSVTTVNVGSGEPLKIVCGAPNVAAGQKVLVALEGTTLHKGEESVQIKKSKIRGEISEGMICAEDELGLGTDHTGIIVLDSEARPGTRAEEYFNVVTDTIFEIGLTPNRIDSGSHFGVARDLAAYLSINNGGDYKAVRPSVDDFKPDNTSNTINVIVENRTDCPRYTGLTISGVTVGESPDWLKVKLKAIGLNPISNVVDITNFVQHEIGQPLHAFDADKIEGRKVIVKNLPDKTGFVALDGTERSLSSRDLMICNVEEGMCIAGVFGGIRSGVTDETRNIFLESAHFNPVSIRKTSKRLGLQTDASFRFERGTDPNINVWALKRAAILIKECAGGKISSEIIDIYPEKIPNVMINASYSNIIRLIGKKIDQGTIRNILSLLDINILEETGDKLLLEIPAYRVDVKQEADVTEEIMRIYGYNNIEVNSHVNSTLTFIEKPDKEKIVNIVSDLLSGNGFAEIMCNSLVPAAWYEHNEDFNAGKLVMLANPLSSDLNAMRQSLLFGGLGSIAWTINRQNSDLKFYEFGNCYFRVGTEHNPPVVDDYKERTSLDLFISGNVEKESWHVKPKPTNFFIIKAATEMVFSRLDINPENMILGESGKKYFYESISYSLNNNLIAETGKVSRSYLKMFDINQDVWYSHIDWDVILKIIRNNSITFTELPKYPSVRRDLAILIDKSVKFSRLKEIAFRIEKNILREVNLFDVYESESLGVNKKSYAVSFVLRDEFKTLTDKAIDKVMNNLIRTYESEVGARIR
jgi:phenylalanyl-tRNA synthetase beta chain